MTDTFTVENGYIELPVTTDEATLYQDALTAINDALPGWTPQEGHIEVLLLEQFAQMCAESAQVAALVPQSIFSYFGSLIGINPISGSQATAQTTWTMINANGYTVPAGTLVGYQILGNQVYTFETVDTFTIPGPSPGRNISSATVTTGSNILTCASGSFTSAGDVGRLVTDSHGTTNIPSGTIISSVTSPTTALMSNNATGTPGAETITLGNLNGQTSTAPGAVTIIATSVGSLYNGLVPQNLVLNTALSFVSTIASTTATAGGEDAETTAAYLNRLSEELQLLAPRPILPNDFAVLAVNTPNADVFRSGAINLLNPFNNEMDQADSTGSPNVGSWTATGATLSAATGAGGESVIRATASATSVTMKTTDTHFVAQNTPYVAMVTIDHPSAFTSETITLGVTFYDVNHSVISTASSVAVNPSTTALTWLPLLFTTPANTFTMNLTITIANSVSARTYDFTYLSFALQPPFGITNLVVDSDIAEVTLAKSWATSGALSVAGFKTGENCFQYTGTGAASGTITATSKLFYLPAGTYNFSAYLDASNATSGSPQALVKSAGGTTEVTLTQTAGAKSTLNSSFTLGAATMVDVILQTNNCTVQSGLLLTFAEPQILSGSAFTAYTGSAAYTAPNTSTNQERSITVVPLTDVGTGLLPAQQALVASYLNGLREVNFQVNVIGPNYAGIDVTWAGVALDGYNPATVLANANAALTAYLNPANWAGGTESPPVWDLTQTIVRYLSLVTVLGETPGIDYLTSVQIGFHGQTALGTADLTMPGYAPLPTAGTINGNVTALPS